MAQSRVTTINLTNVDYRDLGNKRRNQFGHVSWTKPVPWLENWEVGLALFGVLTGFANLRYNNKVASFLLPVGSALAFGAGKIIQRKRKATQLQEQPKLDMQYNLAPGLAWSFHDGYIRVLAQGRLKKIIDKLKVITVPRVVILFPFNGKMQDSLEMFDNLTVVGKVTLAEADRGGQAKRQYEAAVYEIIHREKYYYCLIDSALGIDNISKMVNKKLVDQIPADKKKDLLESEYSSYVTMLEDYAENEKLQLKSDFFLFLLYNGIDDDGETQITTQQLMKGMRIFCSERDLDMTGFPKRINVTKRLKDLGHKGIITDKLIESIEPVKGNSELFNVKLKGSFLEGEDPYVQLTRSEISLATTALKNANLYKQPGMQSEDTVKIQKFYELPKKIQHDILEVLSKRIGDSWKDLYRGLMKPYMNVQEMKAALEGIEYKLKWDRNLSELSHFVLEKWTEKLGSDATINSLSQVLIEIDKKFLADEITKICG